MYWNSHTLQSFAPDAATLERAREIAYVFRWEKMLGNEQILWGEYKTGVDPFCTAVHLHHPQHTCSCPSRRRPCKHVLALLLLYLNGSDGFQVWHDYPDWVEKWLNRQKKKPAATIEKPAQIAPPEKTLAQMQAGIAELQEWLFDLVRHGLASALSREANYWDTFAASMTDAKLGGIGRRIRGFKNLQNLENAHEKLLAEIAELYLFVKGFQQSEKLPTELQQELLNQAGVNIKKEEILAQQGLKSNWFVIAQVEKTEENLRTRRTWLWSQDIGQAALLLDFVWGNADFMEQWNIGSVIRAEIAFYPGAYQQRALVKNFESVSGAFTLSGYADWAAFANNYAEAIAQNPWINTFPVLIDDATPIMDGKQLLLIDNAGKQLPAQVSENNMWKILAISGGHPIQLFGEWDNQFIYPLSIFDGNRVISL
ncbi:MAG: SWIM zinc finger family protein [Saprospiraceae bacterium]|nr:SWIM zinc finger family protein [Saprospiraceae bacterium]